MLSKRVTDTKRVLGYVELTCLNRKQIFQRHDSNPEAVIASVIKQAHTL